MIVMKFGGTSVEDAKAMLGVAAIVQANAQRKLLVVSSACAGVTNTLLSIARRAVDGEKTEALAKVKALRVRHRAIAADLFVGELREEVEEYINQKCNDLSDLAKSIAVLGELTDRSLDTFASFGEKLSTFLLSHLIRQKGLKCSLISATDVVITSDDYTSAQPLFGEIDERANRLIAPLLQGGEVVVTQGFVGATARGVTTTIGRGGSDYSAAILGAALDAEEIQIWTDVDGIMTCDPSVIPNARLLSEMTFREAAELAYFGAKVLHPSTILPAVKKNIPVRVLNTRNPDGKGTTILSSPSKSDATIVRAIAFKGGITLINIDSTRMLGMHGFLAKVFEVFAKYEQSVDAIATSEVSISLTVDREVQLESIFKELREIADVDMSGGKAIFCVVGEDLKTSRGIFPRIFATLDRAGINVGLISLGASEINMTFVVDESEIKRTAQALHDEFFP